MMLSKSKIPGNKGFTLIEIIVTLVVAGILAIFYFHFMGTAMDFSWKSVELVAGEARAEGVMEQIIAGYVDRINENPDGALAAIKAANYGAGVIMVYVIFDSAGNEAPVPSPGTSNNLKVTVEAAGNNLTSILTKSRDEATDPIVSF